MDVTIALTGTTPLLMHNPRMIDPEFELKRELSQLTSKRKRTDADNQRIEALEWFGGLYEVDGVVTQPTSKVRKCLIEAARIHKLGKNVERALQMTTLDEPLEYDGPADIHELFQTGQFQHRASVVVSKRRIMKVRPKFMPWALTVPAVLLDDAGLNFDELERIANLAGTAIGIGDGRSIGFGRFKCEVYVVVPDTLDGGQAATVNA